MPRRPRAIPTIAILLVLLAVLGVISFALTFATVGFQRGNGPGTFVNRAGP
jgi:ABC-type transporter Mla subunit MlaD